MRHIQGENRHQQSLLPASLEDYIADDHPVRVIDALVDKLDLASLGFSKAVPKDTGRKPYHPGDLLKLYVYGYLNQVTSSRRLERECHRNIEVLWLMGRLAPDFKTIADFRKDNGPAIGHACRDFVAFCRQWGLVKGALIAIDGSKFKAAASKDQALTRQQLERDRVTIERRVAHYLAQLDQADEGDEGLELKHAAVHQALAQLERLDGYEQAMDAGQRNEHSASEPEARLMRSGREGTVLGYNVQTAVDEGSGLILHHDITQDAGDTRQLQPMAEAVKAALQVDALKVVADAGYCNGEQLANCEAQRIEPNVPRRVVPSRNKQLYQKADFRYDRERDECICPAGEVLRYWHSNRDRKHHVYMRSGCNQCPLQQRCTHADRRTVTRHFYEDALERAEARLRANPQLRVQRMVVAERPFAMIKQALALRRFRCWGLAGARSEIALAVTGYNLKQMIDRQGVPRMLALLA